MVPTASLAVGRCRGSGCCRCSSALSLFCGTDATRKEDDTAKENAEVEGDGTAEKLKVCGKLRVAEESCEDIEKQGVRNAHTAGDRNEVVADDDQALCTEEFKQVGGISSRSHIGEQRDEDEGRALQKVVEEALEERTAMLTELRNGVLVGIDRAVHSLELGFFSANDLDLCQKGNELGTHPTDHGCLLQKEEENGE